MPEIVEEPTILNDKVALSGVKATLNSEAEKPVSFALLAQEFSESDWMTRTADVSGVTMSRMASNCLKGARHCSGRMPV